MSSSYVHADVASELEDTRSPTNLLAIQLRGAHPVGAERHLPHHGICISKCSHDHESEEGLNGRAGTMCSDYRNDVRTLRHGWSRLSDILPPLFQQAASWSHLAPKTTLQKYLNITCRARQTRTKTRAWEITQAKARRQPPRSLEVLAVTKPQLWRGLLRLGFEFFFCFFFIFFYFFRL